MILEKKQNLPKYKANITEANLIIPNNKKEEITLETTESDTEIILKPKKQPKTENNIQAMCCTPFTKQSKENEFIKPTELLKKLNHLLKH